MSDTQRHNSLQLLSASVSCDHSDRYSYVYIIYGQWSLMNMLIMCAII